MAEPKKPWPMIEYAGENNPVTLYYLKKPNLVPRAFLINEEFQRGEGPGKLWSRVIRNVAFFSTRDFLDGG